MAAAMGRASKWDFTADFVAALFIVAPAIIAYIHKMPGWRYVVGVMMLPVVLIIAAMIYYVTLNHINESKAKEERMQKYDSSKKIEQAIGIPFPDFEIIRYKENRNKISVHNNHICRSKIRWKETPTSAFFLALDSLCITNPHWRTDGKTYVFDSIQGVGVLSRMELSLIIEKEKKEADIEYDL